MEDRHRHRERKAISSILRVYAFLYSVQPPIHTANLAMDYHRIVHLLGIGGGKVFNYVPPDSKQQIAAKDQTLSDPDFFLLGFKVRVLGPI